MLFQESETIELKEIVVDDVRKEIIAFANCQGGTLYIGVRKDGTVAGVEDPDGVALQISNQCHLDKRRKPRRKRGEETLGY